MKYPDRGLLRRLGAGETIANICEAAGWSRSEFDDWWQQTIRSRVPSDDGTTTAAVQARVDIERDEWGIPHIFAENEDDLFFGLGYAMAQDRLFQLDWLRRRGTGRLSEILGPEGLEFDLVARTVGLNRIAEAEWGRLPAETRRIVNAFTAGVNSLIDATGDNLPIEFDLLDYRPQPWSPIDCLAIENEFRWYLTGRFPIIAIPELAKRTLGDGPLYREFLLGEADDEVILPPGSYPPASDSLEPVGQSIGGPETGLGSNNWVVSGKLTASGHPMVASDPHIAFAAVSCWYETHLHGGSFNVAGSVYVGIPAVMLGRTERVAWGLTNNICSQRDLYHEQTSPEHPGCFLFDGRWEPAGELTETIHVKGAEPVTKTIRFSCNGPVVDDILPPPANRTGPVTLKWLGASQGGWLTAMLGMNRAQSVQELREAMRPWHVPTFNLVFADVEGHIGLQSTGRIPIRKQIERGYRPGWDPDHQWQGLLPFDAMPHLLDPDRGWILSANHRTAADDYPHKLHGCWSSGWRGRRIRQMIEAGERFSRDDFARMQLDSISLRAAECVPALLRVLKSSDQEPVLGASRWLEDWDCRSEPDSVGATLFNVFFTHWSHVVAEERFDGETADLLSKATAGIASRLLAGDPAGWFADGDRPGKIVAAFNQTLEVLTQRFGADMSTWTWGKLHQLSLHHVLSSHGDLSQLLDHGEVGVRGDMVTVCNAGPGPDWAVASGATYRLITELGISPPELWAVDSQSQSGHPGSPHYEDQLGRWLQGGFHCISLDRKEAVKSTKTTLTVAPRED